MQKIKKLLVFQTEFLPIKVKNFEQINENKIVNKPQVVISGRIEKKSLELIST